MVAKVGCYLDSIRITLCSKEHTSFDDINAKLFISSNYCTALHKMFTCSECHSTVAVIEYHKNLWPL